ncbi:hypothetical protein BHE74_00016559 [Ensete ventricosum]|nr:hypothetical protein BHE74_00016559 [Ensete ventricosum]
MTRSTWSSSATSAGTPTSSTPMCTARGRGTGSSSSTSGSIPPRTSTPTRSCGIPDTSCESSLTLHRLHALWRTETCPNVSSSSSSSDCSIYVDDTPIREFRNRESIGVPYPKSQAMRVYSSLWDAEDWATRGGLVKTDWSQAPFTAAFRNYNANGCVWPSGASSCSSGSSNSWMWEEFDATSLKKLRWVQKNYMIYNYCTDAKRFSRGLPPDCSAS